MFFQMDMTWTDRSFIVSLWTSRLNFHPSFYFLSLKEVLKLSSIHAFLGQPAVLPLRGPLQKGATTAGQS